MKTFLTLLLIQTASLSSIAQDSLFSKVYYDTWAIESKRFTKSHDDGLVIIGRFQYNNAFVTKLDSLGNEIWHRTFDYTSSQNTVDFDGIAPLYDSTYIISAHAYNDSRNRWEAQLLKIDEAGDTLWTRTYGLVSQTNCINTSVVAAKDSTIVLAWSGENDNKLFINKVGVDGSLLWSVTHTGTDNLYLESLVQADDSIFYAGVRSNSSGRSSIIRFNESGAVNWAKEFESSHLYDVETSGKAALFLSTNLSNGYINLTKVSDTGSVLWHVQAVGGLSWVDWEIPQLTVLSDSTIHILIPDNSMSSMFHLDKNGGLITNANLELTVTGTLEATNKGVFILGNGPLYGIKSLTEHIGLIRADSLLNAPYCVATYVGASSTPSSYVQNDINLVSSSGMLEYQTNFTSYLSWLLIAPGCVDFYGGLDEFNQVDLVRVFPNISNGVYYFESLESSEFTVAVTNIRGERVYFIDQTTGNFEIDLSPHPNGMYFYSVIDRRSQKRQSGKLVLNK